MFIVLSLVELFLAPAPSSRVEAIERDALSALGYSMALIFTVKFVRLGLALPSLRMLTAVTTITIVLFVLDSIFVSFVNTHSQTTDPWQSSTTDYMGVDPYNLDSATIDAIYASDFGHIGICPSLPHSTFTRFTHLTSCTIAGGQLQATLSSEQPGNIGMLPLSETEIRPNIQGPVLPTRYYLEARFRALGGAPSLACGIAIEGSGAEPSSRISFFFHSLQWGSDQGSGYNGEVLTTAAGTNHPITTFPSSGSPSSTKSLAFPQASTSISAYPPRDFVIYDSGPIPYSSNEDGWTQLGILIKGNSYFLVIDNIFALFDKPLNLDKIDTVGPAVLAGSQTSSGTASCAFSDFSVRQLL